jgi:ATP-dependent protease ClpP protease subunit
MNYMRRRDEVRETIAEDQENERVFTAAESVQYGLIDRVNG